VGEEKSDLLLQQILLQVNQVSMHITERAEIIGKLQSDFAELHSRVALHEAEMKALRAELASNRLSSEKRSAEVDRMSDRLEEYVTRHEEQFDRLERSVEAQIKAMEKLADAVSAQEPALTKSSFLKWSGVLVGGIVAAYGMRLFDVP
jgi:uncharacterized coiled-coil protein SlyX